MGSEKDEIEEMPVPVFPYGYMEVMQSTDEEGNIIGEPYSFEDLEKRIKEMSGINEFFT